jgi:xylitol oxidase
VVVALGALGIVTKLTLDLVPSFRVTQSVYENLPLSQVQANYEAIVSSGYSVSLFTDWRDEIINQVWLKRRVTGENIPDPESFFGAAPASADRHPIRTLSPINCTAQMGIPGHWYERLPHFRMDFTPSSGEELQSEYFVPQQHAVDAITAVASLAGEIAPYVLVSEIRTIAADAFWLSPCYHQPCTAIHFTWADDWDNVSQLLPLLESVLAPFQVRPHWGKLFTLAPLQLQMLYPKMPSFRELAGSFDPNGKFRNAFLDAYVFGS